MPADDLLGLVSLDGFGTRVPADDASRGIEHQQRIVAHGLDEDAEADVIHSAHNSARLRIGQRIHRAPAPPCVSRRSTLTRPEPIPCRTMPTSGIKRVAGHDHRATVSADDFARLALEQYPDENTGECGEERGLQDGFHGPIVGGRRPRGYPRMAPTPVSTVLSTSMA